MKTRTREGMAVAKANGKQPKLSAEQQSELARMAAAGEHIIADLAHIFSVSRTTIYRTLQHRPTATKAR